MVTVAATITNVIPAVTPVTHEIVDRAREGDRQAFFDLYKRHSRSLYSLALQLTGNTPAAEDLTRDIFIAAFSNLEAVSDDASFFVSLRDRLLKSVLVKPEPEGRENFEASARSAPASEIPKMAQRS